MTNTALTKRSTAIGIRPRYHSSKSFLPRRNGAINRETMLINLIRMFNEGPEVSLKGSPTVSPITHALPCSVFLSPTFSQSFLALSQAPPALDIMMASIAPETMEPARRPMRHCGPTRNPMQIGERMAYAPGATISLTEDAVEMATHLSESGSTSSPGPITSPLLIFSRTSRRPGISLNCRRTS